MTENWEDEFGERMDKYQALLREKVQQLSRVIRRLAQNPPPDLEDAEYLQVQADITKLRDEQEILVQDAMARIGITDEEIEHRLEMRHEARVTGTQDLILRTELVSDNVESTGTIEELLPSALETLLRTVDPGWLRAQKAYAYRLDETYWRSELSLVGCTRVSPASGLHRFAQYLLVAQDLLERQEAYDFWAGALCVPTVVALGLSLEALKGVRGDVNERIQSLHHGHPDLVDSTIYELLVAGACVRQGRHVELLEPDKSGKTPEMRLHDLPMPYVVECKRRPSPTQYEQTEERYARILFRTAATECRKFGFNGVVSVEFTVELEDVAPTPFGDDIRRVVKYGMRQHQTGFAWGNVTLRELPERGSIDLTRLYSPRFVGSVFGWNLEIPDFDGMICHVTSPGELFTDVVEKPFGMKWNSLSDGARIKKSRPLGSLLNKAISQIPLGEMGSIFLCYQESGRPEVADERTRRILEELQGWHHHWGIQMPSMCVNRLLPRPLGEGLPDLIENVFQCKAETADAIFQDVIPSRVFTSCS